MENQFFLLNRLRESSTMVLLRMKKIIFKHVEYIAECMEYGKKHKNNDKNIPLKTATAMNFLLSCKQLIILVALSLCYCKRKKDFMH